MPVTISDVGTLKTYVEGVMQRAEHHANNVDAIGLALAGAIIWRSDGPIQVRAQDGDMKNVLWATIGGQRYAFSYNHETQGIELRKGTTHGEVIHSFSNSTPLQEVEQLFRNL